MSNIRQFIEAVPRSALNYILAPLVLLLVPIVLWSSVSATGASGATPVWLTVSDLAVFQPDPIYVISLGDIGLLAVAMITFEASLAAFSLHFARWICVYVSSRCFLKFLLRGAYYTANKGSYFCRLRYTCSRND